MNKKKRALSPKRQRFVEEYLKDLNATKAAIRAGYVEKWAETIGPRLVRESTVREAISQREEELLKKGRIKQQDLLEHLACILTANVNDLFDQDGTIILPPNLPAHVAKAVKSVQIYQKLEGKDNPQVVSRFHYTFYDKTKVTDQLMKHLGMYLKDNEQKRDGLIEALMRLVDGATRGLPKRTGPAGTLPAGDRSEELSSPEGQMGETKQPLLDS